MPKNPNSLQDHLSDDLQFLVACCQTETSEDDEEFILSYLSQITDHQSLITAASQHGILPLVYKTIKNLSNNNLNAQRLTLNANILTELKSAYLSIAQRNMLMTAELIKIMKLLKENDIEALAFKGPALAESAYGDITLRQYGDLDILIRKKDRSKMMDLMIEEHYIPEINLKEDVKETFFDCVNVIGLYKESTSIMIEVHWELLSKNYAIDWEEETLWSEQKTVQINHKDIPVLSLEQQLLYLCAHGAKHLFERLEWVCDIDRSIRTNPNISWQNLLTEAEKLGIKRMLYLGLALSQQLFRLEIPETVQKYIAQDKQIPKLISKVIEINFSENSQEGKSYSSFGLLLSMREKLTDQLRFSWRALFSPKFDDFVFIQLPRHLGFLYPLVRPYRLLTKYFKR